MKFFQIDFIHVALQNVTDNSVPIILNQFGKSTNFSFVVKRKIQGCIMSSVAVWKKNEINPILF
jgi:hypothetical protein